MTTNQPSKSRDTKLMLQQDEIDALKREQARGTPNMVPANRTITLNPATTLNIREIKEAEAEKYVHVFTRNLHNDDNAKKYNLEDKIIAIHAGEFDTKVKQNYFQSFDLVEIIHDPRQDAVEVNLQPNKRKVEAPVARPAAQGNQSAELRKQAAELKAKEQELIDRQAAIEKKEANLAAKEAALAPEPTPSKK